MKIIMMIKRSFNNLLRVAFAFAFVFASATISIANINYNVGIEVTIENETPKMSVIPDSEEVNKAIVKLYSETESANIVIFNSMGIVVFEENYAVDKMQENILELDLTNFKSGTYYIVHDENKDSATYSVR